MPAALLMATFQASLRTLMFEPLPLQRVVGRLNRYAFEHSLEGRRFTTAFLAEIDLRSGLLTYVNAGHNAPILRRAGGAIERLETGGLLLGVREPVDYQAGSLTLAAGDTLVIFTDGVADARSRRGEQYGEQRLVELMRTLPDGSTGPSAEATLQRVLRAVDAHVQDAPQEDDVTCLVLRYQGAGSPPAA
jgi:sigma-B regulation protein RsbU (phosphoserine phosphatase)